jgi:peroxiredoxin Q/BCP
MIQEKEKAPNFTLENDDNKQISLSDFSGKWVLLYFYPKDDTPGCITEACTLRDNFPFYEDTGISVIGVSKDTPVSHKRFKEKYELPFNLLSDIDGKVSEIYGSGIGETPKRISYLINPEGIIEKTYPEVNPATHAQEVLEDLKQIKP